MGLRSVVVWLLLSLVACAGEAAPDEEIGRAQAALGEPVDGFPSWQERVVHVWTNRARADPAADLAGCSSCAEAGCYTPVAPLVWDHNLGRSARFHSDNLVLGGCGLQHDSPCTVVSDIDAQYTPGPCNGDPSCGCAAGSFMCGSVGTTWSSRIALFGSSARAENIARGSSSPVSTFYQWLWEPDSNPACGWRTTNGHRANILGGSRSIGVGKAVSGTTWTQDFGGSGTPSGIVSGVHYPETGSSIEFRANWYGTAAPATAMVSVEGTCAPLALERGSETNGTYLATASVGSGCTHYYFHFTDAGGADVFYPTTGSFGIGCAADWSTTRPAPCGPCTADCTGRTCGSDGCGGSCGTCTGGQSCNASGACVCSGTLCGGVCIDTDTDPANCGGCGVTCAAGEFCAAGVCRCSPDCSGRTCGDDGCGGSCGSCPSERMCNASGACVCTSGTDCGGACVDTMTDPNNCGSCGTRCRGSTRFCVGGTCTAGCTPDCTGRSCGSDGCSGSCGACPMGQSCNTSGACVCPMGTTDCGGTCVDTATDPASCGACGTACGMGESCVAGSCTTMCVPDCTGKACGSDGCGGSCGTCASGRMCDTATGACMCSGGLSDCGGTCVDTDVNPAHCGGCGSACAVGETCAGGTCSCVPSCGGRSCGGDGCGGTCGTCASGRVCTGGSCDCSASATDCGGTCTDVRVDVMNCGSCGTACAAGESCVAGACTTDMPDAGCTPACAGRDCGDDTCGGSCGDCASDRLCASGGVCACNAELTECGGICVDTRVDSLHCGACDAPCGAGLRCVGGVCDGMPTAMPDGGTADGGVLSDGGSTPRDSATGDGGALEPITGGCGCSSVRAGAPIEGALWLIFGLLAFLRRRG